MKISVKRILCVSAVIAIMLPLVLALTSCSGGTGGDVTTLYVYNWGEYMSDGSEGSLDVNKAFEDWYYQTYGERVKVTLSTYSSNEDMYAKLSGGAVNYDVIVPSDYMIQRLIK